MSNNAAGLNGFIDTQLGDGTDVIWTSAEKDNVISWVVSGLWPRIKRPIDPTAGAENITFVADTYTYTMPTGMLAISKIEFFDTDGDNNGEIMPGAWAILGSVLDGTAKIQMSETIVDQGGSMRIHGYGRYDVSSNLIPDDYVPLVLAEARAELLRRLIHDRARFKAYQARQQWQNTTVNELIQLVNEADFQARQLRQRYFTFQLPVPARVG